MAAAAAQERIITSVGYHAPPVPSTPGWPGNVLTADRTWAVPSVAPRHAGRPSFDTAGSSPLMVVAPSASYSFTVRLEIRNRPGMLGRVTSVIGKTGGDIGAVDLVEMTGQRVIRDITVKARDSRHGHDILDGLKAITGVRVANISDRTFLMHLGGKIEVKSKVPIRTRDDLSMAYTPGVARVCLAISG